MANPVVFNCYEIHFTDPASFPNRFAYATDLAGAVTKAAAWITANYPVPKPGPVIAAVVLLGQMV